MPESDSPRGWIRKFGVALSGLKWAVWTQTSFWVHIPVALAVLVLAGLLQVELWRWIALVLAIALVMTAELLNTAIEQLVKVLHPDHDPRIGQVLDVASAGVLVATMGSIVIGLLTFIPPRWELSVG